MRPQVGKALVRLMGNTFALIWRCEAATYYVSLSGNDRAVGTSSSVPWRTLDRVNRQAGDLLGGGADFLRFLTFDQSENVTAAWPISISSYGTGATSGTPDGLIFLNDLPKDVKLPYIVIQNVDVGGFCGDGVSTRSLDNKSGFADVRITNVIAHKISLGGIAVWGQSNTSVGGYSHRNICVGYSRVFGDTEIFGNNRPTGNEILVSDTDTAAIERSLAYRNGALNTNHSSPMEMWVYDRQYCVIQYNESFENRTSGAADGGGFDLDGGARSSTMQYNYSRA